MNNLDSFSNYYGKRPVLVTFIYPEAIQYLDFLITNFNSQSDLNFSILFFNDGVKNLKCHLNKIVVPYIIIDIKGKNPKEIRFKGLELLKNVSFNKIIFQDSDDGLSLNRIEVASKLLDTYALVVNDLDLMDEKGKVYVKNIWQNRFNQKNEFNYKDIEHLNFVGLGNTSIKKELLNYLPKCPQIDITAVDWFVFYIILRSSDELAYRTSNCTSTYRQHQLNTIGLNNDVGQEIFYRTIKLHKKALQENNFNIPKNRAKNNSNKPDAFWWE